MHTRVFMAAFTMMIMLSATLAGCINDDNSKISDTLIEVPFTGPVDERECFDFDIKERCWLIHIPETATYGFCEDNSCPLLMDIHGLGVTVGDQSNLSDYSRITDQDNVIIVHPEGVDNGWNFGWCCTEEDDVGFLLKLIDRVIEERNIDENRIYLTGWSNGCYMSQEMASLASKIITAVACMAGYTDEPIPSDYSPVPIMEIHGLIDPLLLYGSSSTASIQVVGTLEGDEGAIQNMYHWADANNCPGLIPDVETANWDYSIKKFTNCANNTEVVLFTMNYAQHNPYLNDYDGAEGNPTGIDASQIAWDFLKDFTKEGI